MRRVLEVDRQLVGVVHGRPVFGPVKDKKNRLRTIPLADVVVSGLVEHDRRYGLGPDELIFTSERGLPIRRSRFAEIWASAACPLGIPVGDGYHKLRHYYASLLIAGGAPITVVRAMLGHASLATTQIYAHLFPDADDQARAAINRVLALVWHGGATPRSANGKCVGQAVDDGESACKRDSRRWPLVTCTQPHQHS